jgi:hypothetical protein
LDQGLGLGQGLGISQTSIQGLEDEHWQCEHGTMRMREVHKQNFSSFVLTENVRQNVTFLVISADVVSHDLSENSTLGSFTPISPLFCPKDP